MKPNYPHAHSYWNETLSNIDYLVQDYSNPIANALELLQSCTKPSIYSEIYVHAFYIHIHFIFTSYVNVS